jgi:hypothetical protein
MTSMGERIRERRQQLGHSHDVLAQLAKKHGGTISGPGIAHLETRMSNRSNSSRAIALALGVNHDWLLTGKGPKELLKSLDRKMQLLPQDDFDDLYDDFTTLIDRRLEKRNIRQ